MRISDWSSDVCSSDLEAFAMKMLGGLRQEIVFARRQREIGQEPGWISVPLIVTSHTWENSKNEQSHRSEERRVGKSVSVRVDLGGRRIIKKKKIKGGD